MDCSKNQPCESLRALEQKVDGKFREYDERLGDGEVSFAFIKTKLNRGRFLRGPGFFFIEPYVPVQALASDSPISSR